MYVGMYLYRRGKSPLNYVCSSLYRKTNIHMVIRFSLSLENEVATAAERHLRANNSPRDSSVDDVDVAFATVIMRTTTSTR